MRGLVGDHAGVVLVLFSALQAAIISAAAPSSCAAGRAG
jgi:hypothetical protein